MTTIKIGDVLYGEADVAKLVFENERLKRELAESQWAVTAYQQDAAQFSRVFGRTTFEMIFENASGTKQTPTVYVFRDGSAYAPIFGSAARLFKSVEALAHWMEPQLGNGFRFVGAQKRAAVTP